MKLYVKIAICRVFCIHVFFLKTPVREEDGCWELLRPRKVIVRDLEYKESFCSV